MEKTSRPTPNRHLYLAREQFGWSQQELAEKVDTTTVSISRWERGVITPGPYYRQKLCLLFGKSPEELGFVLAHPSVSLWNVPYGRNSFFTAREEVLDLLHIAMTGQTSSTAVGQPYAMSGLGGIGKTHLAVEYAYRHRHDYQSVFWVRAESADLLVSDLLALAVLLDLPMRNEAKQGEIVVAVLRWLDTHEGWLLILDNADTLEEISAYIPSKGTGRVLLTTRAFSTGTIAQRIELDKMTIEEGMLFLLRRMKRIRGKATLESVPESIRSQARAIVEEVDALPLALDQAGAYIEDTGSDLSHYLTVYRTQRRRVLRRRGQDAAGHPEPVTVTWLLSFEKIRQINVAAADLLHLLAFLHPDRIPESLIVAGASALGPVLQPMVTEEWDFNEALGELLKYSLLKRDPEKKNLTIHRLVQAVIRDEMSVQEREQWIERTVAALNTVFPNVTPAVWGECERLLPHVLNYVTVLAPQKDSGSLELASLLYKAATYLGERAQYTQAESLIQQSFAIREQVLGSHHPDTAASLNGLAILFHYQGKYDQAEQFFQQAIAVREHTLGPHHPDTAASLNDLAIVYHRQSKHKQAEQLFQQSVAIREQELGVHHADTAASLNGLALLYISQGKYDQAEPLFERALAIREQALDPYQNRIAESRNNLAMLYYYQSKYTQAELHFQQAVTLCEQMLGLHHPDTAQSLNNLAMLYNSQGKYDQAEPLFEQALAIREQALGLHHPDTAQSLNSLAFFFYHQGKYDQAEPLFQQAIAVREHTLGPHHPDTAQSLNNLGVVYNSQGKYDQAEPLFEQALAIREQALGPHHLDTTQSLNNLALLSSHQGKYEEAESLFQRTLVIREQTLGPHHSQTAESLHNLAEMYNSQGKYELAEPLFQRAQKIWEQALGAEHPHIARPLNGLANLYKELGKNEQAEALYQHALAVRQRQQGLHHPETAESLHDFAHFYEVRQQPEKSLALYQQALVIREQCLGPLHPRTVETRTRYTQLLRARGLSDEKG